MMDLTARMKELKEAAARLPDVLERAATNGALRAVEEAAERTPPTRDDLRGTNTRTGEMKAHWATDSRPKAQRRGDSYESILANDRQYASYVNDGHRMDRHFVPGLVINRESGMLEYNPDGKGGIIVGTKTKFVKGLFMVDAAKKVYQETVRAELREVEEMLK